MLADSGLQSCCASSDLSDRHWGLVCVGLKFLRSFKSEDGVLTCVYIIIGRTTFSMIRTWF